MACRVYLYRSCWPSGFCCPRCQNGKAWPKGTLYECAKCCYQLSVWSAGYGEIRSLDQLFPNFSAGCEIESATAKTDCFLGGSIPITSNHVNRLISVGNKDGNPNRETVVRDKPTFQKRSVPR
ncbi:MAG: transposase [Gammaproteobacteria bacterium]